MAYVAWSVVFGEQPSAAKWNILGANDAEFDTRTTIKRQDNTTNSDKSNSRILTGWGVMTPGVAASVSETVNFSVTFADRPIVVICFGGDAVSATSYGSGDNTIKGPVAAKARLITTTSFVAQLSTADGTNYAAGNTVFYQWIAIGEV